MIYGHTYKENKDDKHPSTTTILTFFFMYKNNKRNVDQNSSIRQTSRKFVDQENQFLMVKTCHLKPFLDVFRHHEMRL